MTLTSRTRQILDRVPRQLNKKFVMKIKKETNFNPFYAVLLRLSLFKQYFVLPYLTY